MHTISKSSRAGAAGSIWSELGALAVDWLSFAAGRVIEWQVRARERTMLAQIDEHGLNDLGLTRADVLRETSKRFWQA